MSAPVTASVSLSWTDGFRKSVLTRAFNHIQAASDKAAIDAKLKSEFKLSQSEWSSAADLIAAFGATEWLSASSDLDALLTRLNAIGASPQSLTGFSWDWSETDLASLAGEIVSRSTRVLNGIAGLKSGEHTFANTLQAMNDNDRIVDLWSTNVPFLKDTSASKSIRDASTELTKALSEFEVSQSMRVDLYDAFKAFGETAEAKALKGEAARFLEFTLRDFKRNGLHLPLEQRKRVEEIKKRMSTLGITFSSNLGEEKSEYEFTKEELDGVPEDQLARFTKSTTDPSEYVVTLKYPDHFPCRFSRS